GDAAFVGRDGQCAGRDLVAREIITDSASPGVAEAVVELVRARRRARLEDGVVRIDGEAPERRLDDGLGPCLRPRDRTPQPITGLVEQVRLVAVDDDLRGGHAAEIRTEAAGTMQ